MLVAQRAGLAVAARGHARSGHAVGDEVGGDCGGPIAGEAQVVLIGAALVGVDADLERLDPRVAGERARKPSRRASGLIVALPVSK